jgi:hypothetical protein
MAVQHTCDDGWYRLLVVRKTPSLISRSYQLAEDELARVASLRTFFKTPDLACLAPWILRDAQQIQYMDAI